MARRSLPGIVKHRTFPSFWDHYRALPEEIRQLADENFALLKADPRHPSLHFKKAGDYWSARVGIHYRAAALELDGEIVWFWIGHHKVYDKLLKRR